MRKITENKEYANLPLIGTKWKLLGFVDKKQKIIKLAKPDGGDSYTLILKEDGSWEGRTSTNLSIGGFLYNQDENKRIEFPGFGPSTYINEIHDGYLYIECMRNVYEFEIDRKGLALVYDKNRYLLFHSYSVEE